MAKFVIAASRPWYDGIAERMASKTGLNFVRISEQGQLNLDFLADVQPEFIFFPHWSWIIPEEVWSIYRCVIFHMTDLPFGRGGSPLQSLIGRGFKETKISALECIKELDAGPVYLKRALSLEGSAEEIFKRAVPIIEEMICEIIENKPVPLAQVGQATCFPRRKPSESDISQLQDLERIYDYIRMLDAPGYPHAFLEKGGLRLEFEKAEYEPGRLTAKVHFYLARQTDEENIH